MGQSATIIMQSSPHLKSLPTSWRSRTMPNGVPALSRRPLPRSGSAGVGTTGFDRIEANGHQMMQTWTVFEYEPDMLAKWQLDFRSTPRIRWLRLRTVRRRHKVHPRRARQAGRLVSTARSDLRNDRPTAEPRGRSKAQGTTTRQRSDVQLDGAADRHVKDGETGPYRHERAPVDLAAVLGVRRGPRAW